MVNKEEIKQSWKKIDDQLNETRRFLQEKKLDEALYFIWIAAENIINSLKTAKNGIYLKDHREKGYILKEYFVLGVLKKDYSRTFEKLSKYRIAAGFHPYTSIPKDYTEKDVLNFLNVIEELKKEAENVMIQKGVFK